MTIENIKAYIERLKTDRIFRMKVLSYSSAEDRRKYVELEGYLFTDTDLQSFVGELNDEELNSIAGGDLIGCQTGIFSEPPCDIDFPIIVSHPA